MAYYLFDRHGVDVSIPTISRLLEEAQWTLKAAKKEAAQRNAALRAHWRAKSLYWQPQQLVFVDESACALRTGDRKRGWSPISLPCHDTQRLRRDKRWSVLPAITIDGYLDEPLIVEGAVTMALFEEWFEEKLLPQLSPGHIVIMDNASIHHSAVVKELAQAAGVQVEYLPPYSPDLNPIELSFNALKAWVKRHIGMACLFVNFGAFMRHAVGVVCEGIGSSGYFEKCGYLEPDALRSE
jgi:transposase